MSESHRPKTESFEKVRLRSVILPGVQPRLKSPEWVDEGRPSVSAEGLKMVDRFMFAPSEYDAAEHDGGDFQAQFDLQPLSG